MAYQITLATFDGQSLTASPFTRCFLRVENSPLATRQLVHVVAERFGRAPADVRAQPQLATWEVHSVLNADTEAAKNNFLKVFSEDRGYVDLVATDESAVSWFVKVRVLGSRQETQGVRRRWITVLSVPDPVWRENSLTTTSRLAISGATDAPTLTNNGTRIARPKITITPDSFKTDDPAYDFNSQLCFRSVVANRAPFMWDNLPLLLVDFSSTTLYKDTGVSRLINNGAGITATATTIAYDTSAGTWPASGFGWIDTEQFYYAAYSGTQFTGCVRGLGGTTATTHADNAVINKASILANGSDIRVFVNNKEVERWIEGINTTNTRVWINATMPPRVKLTLGQAITNAPSPADGGSIIFDEGVADLPESGLITTGIVSETIAYKGRDIKAGAITDINRGTWHRAASTMAKGTACYLVSFVVVIAMGRRTEDGSAGTWPSGSASIGPAPEPLERRPAIQLKSSINTTWRWGNASDDAQTVFYDATRPDRTAMFLPSYEVAAADQNTALGLRLEGSAASLAWQDSAPAASKPLAPRMSLRIPQGIEAIANAITYDVQQRRSSRLRILGRDREGFEIELADRYSISEANATGQLLTPTATLHELIFNGVRAAVTGQHTDLPDYSPLAAAAQRYAQKFVLVQATRVKAILCQLRKAGAGDNFQYRATIIQGDANNPTSSNRTVVMDLLDGVVGSGTAAPWLASQLSTAAQWCEFRNDDAGEIYLPAGDYWIEFRMSSFTSGELRIERGTTTNANSPLYYNSGSGNDVHQEEKAIQFLILHEGPGPIQPESQDMNFSASESIDNLILELNDASADPFTPIVDTGAAATHHEQSTFTNGATGDVLTLDLWMQVTSQGDSGIVIVDTDTQEVKYTQGNWELRCGQALTPSNLDEWFGQEPGSNAITYQQQGMTDQNVVYEHRGAKV